MANCVFLSLHFGYGEQRKVHYLVGMTLLREKHLLSGPDAQLSEDFSYHIPQKVGEGRKSPSAEERC